MVDESSPGMPEVAAALDDEVRLFRRLVSGVDNDVDAVDDAAVDASYCSDVGTLETSCDSTDCTPAPDDVPAAWAAAEV